MAYFSFVNWVCCCRSVLYLYISEVIVQVSCLLLYSLKFLYDFIIFFSRVVRKHGKRIKLKNRKCQATFHQSNDPFPSLHHNPKLQSSAKLRILGKMTMA